MKLKKNRQSSVRLMKSKPPYVETIIYGTVGEWSNFLEVRSHVWPL